MTDLVKEADLQPPQPKHEYKILDSIWFDLIGIVKIDNGWEVKWYIGVGMGFDQEADEQYIAKRGMPFVLPYNFMKEGVM